jgi:ADP-ribose pyrophosphatase YjhB (NUDIX family)
MQRGVPPYVGSWAPPGGFVEAGESPELAAAREIEEEVGIVIHPDRLLPHAIVTVTQLNQLYICFLGILDELTPPRAAAPEALDARWFTLPECSRCEMWEPAAVFDVRDLFRQVQTAQFYFHQRSGDAVRTYGPYSITGPRS